MVANPTESRSGTRRPTRIAGARKSSTPSASTSDAAERNVGLAQRILEHVDFAARRGRVDDQEPEEGAEADHQDRGVDLNCVQRTPAAARIMRTTASRGTGRRRG